MFATTRRQRTLMLLSLLVVMFATAGCGKRGALYLPAPEQQQDANTGQPADEGDQAAPATGS